MKTLKKVLIMLLAALMLTAFVACEPAPEAQKPDPEVKPEPVPEPEAFAITQIYMGGSNGKGFVITNVSDKAANLDDIWYGYNAKITFGEFKDDNSVDHFFALPNVTVDPGCSVFVLNNGYGQKPEKMVENFVAKNGITNYENEAMIRLTADSTTAVTGANAIYEGWMTAAGKTPIFIGKGEMKIENVFESIENPQKDHYYVRNAKGVMEDLGSVKINTSPEADPELNKLAEALRKQFNDSFLVK